MYTLNVLHLRKSNKNRSDIISQPDYSSSASQLARDHEVQGTRREPPWIGRLSIRGHSHSCPISVRLGQCRHTHLPRCASLSCGRKQKHPEKNHADVGKSANFTQTMTPVGNQFFFPHQYYNKMTLNEMPYSRTCYMHFCSVSLFRLLATFCILKFSVIFL